MARTVAVIEAQILTSMTANPYLVFTDPADNTVKPITTNNSARAIFRALAFVVATAIAIFEQTLDVFTAQTEATVAISAAASALWIQAKMFAFQYDATDPQIVQLIDTVPQYPVIDTTKCITTACSVNTTSANNVAIKLAKNSSLAPFDSSQLQAAQAYINIIGDAGINYTCISLASDKLFINADIYYQGQYSAVISTNVNNALTTYLATLSKTNFDGSLKMSDLENVIRSVVGVNDVVLKNVVGRPDSPTPTDPMSNSAGTILIQNSAVMLRQYSSAAGYIVLETVSSALIPTPFNYIPQ